jgi:hypothetical protein
MADNSFDIVSVVDMPEVLNAVQQATKEIGTRFDLKGSNSTIDLQEQDSKLVLQSRDEYTLRAINDVLDQKLVKRKVPLKALNPGSIQEAAGSTVRQEILIQNGIPVDKCKEIVKAIKQAKLKVQASIQGDLVRVSGKSRDDLQEVIALIKGTDFGVHTEFTNYRSK